MNKRNMLHVFLILGLICLIPSALITLPGEADEFNNLPLLDDLYFWIIGDPAYALLKAQLGELDTMLITRESDAAELHGNYSWNISYNPVHHMCYLGLNCRENPPTLGPDEPYMPGAPYGNRTPASELYPLNVSTFRNVLHFLTGDLKRDWLNDIYGPGINRALDSLILPSNLFWFNTDIDPVPYNATKALEILTGDLGWTNSS
ncbi:MAG: hypothetical protein JSV51_09035 [Candidatus Bathyarchaeota archaeon]|nr:MAG: hypothetical protein JSV51_09035 [Candidatus Bathyarchaeota archaeon]